MAAKLPPHHRLLTVICLAFTAIVTLLYLEGWFLADAEWASREWLLTNKEARRSPQNPRIVFLSIDEDTLTLDTLFADDLEKSPTLRVMKQGFPWNREVYAHIIDRLVDAGASAVLFDLIFPQPREGDAAFRAALEKHGDKVVIGSNFVLKGEDTASQSVNSSLRTFVLPTAELQPPAGHPSWIGFVNVHPDGDDLVRHAYFRTTLQEFFELRPDSNAEELLSLPARGLEKAGLAGHIPATHRPVMFRFAENFLPHSLYEIFVDSVWKAPPYNNGEFFRGKIVLIGAAGRSSEDRMQTPFGVMIGPQIHLNALNAALNRDFITETPASINVVLIILGGALAWLLGAWIRRPILRLFLLALTVLVFYELAQFTANELNTIPILLSPLLALAVSGLTWSAWEQILDRVERQRVRRYFERYVSPDLVRELVDNPQSYHASLGGVRKAVTVLFSDVRDFTTMTESADPQALVKQLNEYLGDMVGLVFANQGTLDKFIGDAVMAHWGSFVTDGPAVDAARAVTTALQMQKALSRLNASWQQRGIAPWKIGIGINHGEPITGNIGAAGVAEKFDFTVIGDAVNLASRLEGATKQYGISLCIGERVAELVRDQFLLRSVDLIIVKGKTRPVEIFTVLDKSTSTPPPWLARHEEAVRLYRAGDFAAAEKAWREVLAQVPGDGLAEVFIERCVHLQTHPPVASWTGVYEMTSK